MIPFNAGVRLSQFIIFALFQQSKIERQILSNSDFSSFSLFISLSIYIEFKLFVLLFVICLFSDIRMSGFTLINVWFRTYVCLFSDIRMSEFALIGVWSRAFGVSVSGFGMINCSFLQYSLSVIFISELMISDFGDSLGSIFSSSWLMSAVGILVCRSPTQECSDNSWIALSVTVYQVVLVQELLKFPVSISSAFFKTFNALEIVFIFFKYGYSAKKSFLVLYIQYLSSKLFLLFFLL